MAETTSILHELYAFCEWKPEPEYIQKPDNILPDNISGLWRWIKFFGPKKSLLDSITLHKERQLKWHIAIGDEGKVIAVLTDNILEIRTKRSDYATIAARTTVPRDAYPQWRKVVWSPDCAFIAVAYGNGVVGFFDLTASNLFNIPTDCSRPGGMECTDNTHAVADIIFMPLRVKDNKWNWEVLIITFDGHLRAFLVSGTAGFARRHEARLWRGVGAALAFRDTLYVASAPVGSDPSSALCAGITAWRVLNDEPFYKLSVVSDKHEADLANKGFSLYLPFISSKNMAFVVSMCVSPDGSKMACLHCNGEISVWTLPLLKLVNRWPLAVQPKHDIMNPMLDVENNTKDKMLFFPSDLTWWSDEEVILSRFNGRVSVCELGDLADCLQKPQFVGAAPRLLPERGATLALDCTRLDADKAKSEPEPEDTVIETSKELFKSILYAITDMEAFQPRPRKITVVSRVYRLLAVKSTTPDELFARKIESGKYGEALELASAFNLDSDRVYQQRWRKTPVSSDAIKNYLSKVSKKIWVVHQCVDRLPESLPAAKELLKFGLQLTNEEILNEINKDRSENIVESSDTITLEDLNAYSTELLRCRHVMLFYKERLKLYEAILRCEKSTYVKDEYDRLRSNNLCHSAKELAKEGRISALTCLWLHISSVPMQLTVLDSIPETINPLEYRHLLLPAFDEVKAAVEKQDDERDWCRKAEFRSIWNSNWSDDASPDSDAPKQDELVLITNWYDQRARDIVNRTGLCSHAITLLSLAKDERNVPGLVKIMFYLITLDTLLYDVEAEEVDLKTLEKMTALETCHCLMRKTTSRTFVSELKSLVIPFLKRWEDMSGSPTLHALTSYLTSLSRDTLHHILLVLQARQEFELDVRTHLELVEECMFAYSGYEQIDEAEALLQTIPKDSDLSISSSEVTRRTERMRRVVTASRAVWRRRLPLTAADLENNAQHLDKSLQTLERMARSLAISLPLERKDQPRKRPKNGREDKPNQQDWEELLQDILLLQDLLYTIVPKEQCYEIYASALLTSGDAPSIKLAAEVLTCANTAPRRGNNHLVSYARSVNLVLKAAREYFNSASSLNDPALDLAKCCLVLIKDENADILEESDLIDSLSLLSSFNLTILPIQVRLCEERMSLIEQCLTSRSDAYLASYKLLNLAKLLRVSGDENTREGRVTQLVCEYAWRAAGGGAGAGAGGGAAAGAALGAARRLAALRHKPAAALLANVAKDQAQADSNTRSELLAAAVTYCSPRDIEDILRSRLSLELERVQSEGAALLEHAMQESGTSFDDDFADAITTPVIEKNDLVAPSKDRKLPLLNYLMESWAQKKDTSDTHPNPPAVYTGELYRSLYPEYNANSKRRDYRGFAASPAAAAALSVPQHQYCLNGGGCWTAANLQVMQKYGESMVFEDTGLAIACLVRGGDTPPKSMFEGKTASAVSTSAVAAAAALRGVPSPRDAAYRTPPARLVRSTLADEESPHLELIKSCLDKLRSSAESARLKSLPFPVNTIMFNADEQYRRGTLFRLVKSSDPAEVELAYHLGSKYGVESAELWAEAAAAAAKIPQPLPAGADRDKAAVLLKERVYPALDGTDHAALINFFTALRELDERQLVHGLSPSEHVKLIKKAKAASKELDYKLVTSNATPECFTSHVVGVMRADSAALLTKFLRQLATVLPLPLPVTVNRVYVLWLTREFFSLSPSQESNKKWTQQFRQCASYFNKLNNSDLMQFIDKICFSHEAVTRVPWNTRSVMVLQAVDYCQQEHEAETKHKNSESTWHIGVRELSRWARFLDNFHAGPVQALVNHATDEIWMEVEMSHGDIERLRVPLSRLVLERDMRRASLVTLLQCLNIDIHVERLFYDIVDLADELESVDTVVTRLIQYHRDGVKFCDDLIERVRAKSNEVNLPPNRQIALLSLSNKSHIQDGEDFEKIVTFSIDLLTNEWSDLDFVGDLNEEMLQSAEGRRSCYNQVVEHSASWRRRKALVDLLTCWPTDRDGESRSLQCDYVSRLLAAEHDASESAALIKMLLQGPRLTEQEIDWLSQNTPAESILNLFWVILLSKSERALETVPKLLNQHTTQIQSQLVADDLIKEALDAGLFTKLVATPFYPHMLNYIMNQNLKFEDDEAAPPSDEIGNYTTQWAIDELVKANFLAEAGHFHLLTTGVPVALRGFSETVLYFKKMANFK